jgi:hypothetical protein
MVLLTLLLPGALSAAEIELQGFGDTYHAVRLHDPYDYLSSRTRLRLEMWASGQDAALFASMNATHNNVITSNTGIELRELYVDYLADSWDLRAGRQIIIWGKADGLAITDLVSPWDYTEFLARDFDDIRLPVDALRSRLLFDLATVEFLWLPVFRPAIQVPQGTPWALEQEWPENTKVDFNETIEPDRSLTDSEIGIRACFYLPGIDFSISSLYTWDDSPTLHRTSTSPGDSTFLRYMPEHHRLTCVGAEVSLPRGDFVLRGEAAFLSGKYYGPEDVLSEEMFERDALNWMLGLDWSPGNDWTLTTQFADDVILDHVEAIRDDEHTMLATLNASKKLLRQTLVLSTRGYIGINDKECFIRMNTDYALTDEVHLLFGFDLFSGDEGMMGQFDDNDEIWMKAKYSY